MRSYLAWFLFLSIGCASRDGEPAPSEDALQEAHSLWDAQTLVNDVHADAIAVSDGFLYYVDQEGGVSRVPTAGGAAKSLSSEPKVPSPSGPTHKQIAVDATHVYWTFPANHFARTEARGKILRVAKSGGPYELLVDGLEVPSGIAVDGANVYFTDSASGTLSKVPLAGGAVTQLATGRTTPRWVATDGVDVFFVEEGPTRLPFSGGVMRVPVGGGAPARVSPPAREFEGLTLDAQRVYYSAKLTVDHNGVYSASKTGGDFSGHHSSSDLGPHTVAVDADRVYFTEVVQQNGAQEGALVLRENKKANGDRCRCDPIAIAPRHFYVGGGAASSAVDNDAIYFVDDLSIIRVAKPSP